MAKKRKSEEVGSHFRKIKGKKKKVKGYKRKAKPKRSMGIHKAETKTVRTTFYRDSQGRLVPKRKSVLLD